MSDYGVSETNGLGPGVGASFHREERVDVYWTDKRLDKVTRLRLLSDPGFPLWDVSYCYGVLKDGRLARVGLPFGQIPKRGFQRFIVEEAKKEGVYAKGIGLLDSANISKLC